MLRRVRKTTIIIVFMYGSLLVYFKAFKKESIVTVQPPIVEDDDDIILWKLFRRADVSSDSRLSVKELTWAINRKVQSHIQDALKNNFKTFFALDKINKNGQVEWNEYVAAYFPGHKEDRDTRERMAETKAAWSEAARSNPGSLNIDEFLGFTHPESSHSIIAQAAEDAFIQYDLDGDGQISQFEFEEGNTNNQKFKIIDTNSDGYVDKREILQFLDPKAPHWSRIDAEALIKNMDDDQNGFLDWEECQKHKETLKNSKFVHPEITLHDSLNFSL